MRRKSHAFSFCIFILMICQLVKVEQYNSASYPANTSNYFSNNPLVQAHAHNDYRHPRPLIDALKLGFTSIEVDVYLLNDILYVAHNRPLFPNPERTLTKLYLEPLFERYKATNGQFFANNNQPISLMIDIKNKKDLSYEKIKKIIAPFQEMLSSWENNEPCIKSVNIVLSGKRPIQKVLHESKRWVQLDGRICDLGKFYNPTLMPIISGHYADVSSTPWFIPRCKKVKLSNISKIAKKVAAEGKKLRIWKTPEEPETWSALLDKGVDLINSDSLQLLSNFLIDRNQLTPLYSLEE